MWASHVPVAESPSSNIEHEAQPSKRARTASEADSLDSIAMQDVAAQGPPRADTASEAKLRDSSYVCQKKKKRQADAGVEELEQDANDGSNEAATLGDDVEMGIGSQEEQALSVSRVNNVAESKRSLRATQPKATIRSKESSIMNIDSPSWRSEIVRFPVCVLRDPMS